MSKILIDRSAVEQALEAMESGVTGTDYDRKAKALRAALEQSQDHFPDAGNRVPTGWKLLPVEPTKDMKAAGAFAAMDQVRRSYNPPSAYIPVDSMALLSYRAMIAAAPQPPTTEQSSAVQPQVEQEPVAWIEHEWSGSGLRHLHFERPAPTVRDEVVRPVWTPLYTHPQPPHQPLTEDEINTIWRNSTHMTIVEVVRAIEAAHGIGGEA